MVNHFHSLQNNKTHLKVGFARITNLVFRSAITGLGLDHSHGCGMSELLQSAASFKEADSLPYL